MISFKGDENIFELENGDGFTISKYSKKITELHLKRVMLKYLNYISIKINFIEV